MTTQPDIPKRKLKPFEEDVYLQRVRPDGWRNPPPKDIYDLVILGAGPAGFTAAELALRLGFQVALVERNRMGGNSLNVGSIPSKALIGAARPYGRLTDARNFGAPMAGGAAMEFSKVMERMRRIRARVAASYATECLTRLGCDIFFGTGRFQDAHTLCAGETPLKFRKALVATGAHPRVPDIQGLKKAGFRTSSSIFELNALPRRLAVIGGGPLGCEIAQAFCRLGSWVSLIQNEPKFLPREERDAAEILSRHLAQEGVEIRLNTEVVGAKLEAGTKVLETRNSGVEDEVRADEILLSVGRIPIVDTLGLEEAGVAFDDKKGIHTDDFLRTTNPDVYAAGDICFGLKFTNAAEATARLAVRNALKGETRKHGDLLIPWCTFCDPEIAHIGLQVWEARQQNLSVESYTVLMQDIDRAITDADDDGFVKIHVELGTDRILGATIMSSRASELINQMSVVMHARMGLESITDVSHTYPAESDGIAMAALAALASVRERRRATQDHGKETA